MTETRKAETMSHRLGLAVQQRRRERRVSQAELAAMMGDLGYPWVQSTVNRIEHGQRNVTFGEATALAIALDLTLDMVAAAGVRAALANYERAQSELAEATERVAALEQARLAAALDFLTANAVQSEYFQGVAGLSEAERDRALSVAAFLDEAIKDRGLDVPSATDLIADAFKRGGGGEPAATDPAERARLAADAEAFHKRSAAKRAQWEAFRVRQADPDYHLRTEPKMPQKRKAATRKESAP